MKVKGFWISILLIVMIFPGCSAGDIPLFPDTNPSDSTVPGSYTTAFQDSNRMLWGYYDIELNTDTLDYQIIPQRFTSTHYNILSWLETSPCVDCLKIVGVTPQPDSTIDVEIAITHPFDSPNLTGFDVRGIVMFPGNKEYPEAELRYRQAVNSGSELMNPDGFTTLYNYETGGMGPGGLQGYIQGKLSPEMVYVHLSGYKRFISSDPSNTRNCFFAGETISQIFNIYHNSYTFKFSYAVDSCWAPPLNIPVIDPISDFPISANCEEPWKIETTVEDIGDGLNDEGGSVHIQFDVHDHQGMDSHFTPVFECPRLFYGTKQADFVQDNGEYSTWEIIVTNEKPAIMGTYYCLISVEDKQNDPVTKPWLDLTAYQIVILDVDGEFSIVDVTPPELKNQIPNPNFAFVHEGYLYVTTCIPDALKIVDVSVPEEAFLVATYPVAGSAYTVVVEDDIAYVIVEFGMLLLDVTDPTSPQFISSHEPAGWPHGVDGDIAVSSAGVLGFMLHDINPPEEAHYIKHVWSDELDFSSDAEIVDGYAYSLKECILEIVDYDPVETAAIVNIINFDPFFNGSSMADWSNYLFFTSMINDVFIYDNSDPEAPTHLTSIDINNDDYLYTIEVYNGIAFIVAHTESGLLIEYWDVDPPSEAKRLGYGPTPNCTRLCVDSNYIYPSWYSQEFAILKYE